MNGLLRDKGGPVFDPFYTGNLDWHAEGGRLVGASAGQGQRIDLRREFNNPKGEDSDARRLATRVPHDITAPTLACRRHGRRRDRWTPSWRH